ncbi:MAG: sensor histidine kinase [Chloroflexota bacterium]
MGSNVHSAAQLTDDDAADLGPIGRCLPILADLARGDVFLFQPADDLLAAVVLAEAKPHTVPSNYNEPLTGRLVRQTEEPSVIRALSRGTGASRSHRLLVQGHPTVQDVYPIRQGTQVIGAVAIEVGLVESERQKRKSIVYRRAIDRLRHLVITGQLEGAENLSRLSEHDGPMVVGGDGRIVYISSVAEQLYRKIGYTHSLLHHDIGGLRTDESVFFKAMESGACVEQLVQEGQYTWLKRAIPLLGQGGERIWRRVMRRVEPRDQIIVTIHDVTEESQKERELKIKSAMIKEIHHRVKNNLQTIASLLRLQARRTGSPEIGAMLQETINRILSIAVIHEFLAHQDANNIDMRDVAQRIISEVSRGIVDPEKRIRFVLDATDPTMVLLPTQQATSCALVINELLHNAVEHGFASAAEGSVQISLGRDGNRVIVEVRDDGEPLPPGFDPRNGNSLGLHIVQTLVQEDLKGTFALVNSEQSGVKAVVSFPAVE